jgi:molybdopterin molybdotransferase
MPVAPFFDVRMRGFRDRADVVDVMRVIQERIRPLGAESISLPEACGRVLAEEVCSASAVPAFDRAAMDGYALRAEDTFGAATYNPLEFKIVGEARPAHPFADPLQRGQAVRIMTGAPLPDGADAVLQAEAASEDGATLRVSEPIPALRNVGRRGEDITPGQMLLPCGRVLRPQDLGILASIGIARIRVVRRPNVRIIVTGDELLPCGSKPQPFHIVDSNSVMLAALVRRDGGAGAAIALIPDQPGELRAAILDQACDMLLLSGGTSVGREDHAPSLLAELGELAIHGLALRPASPTGVGFLEGRPVFLLPGNPVSCLCAYDLFAGIALRRLGGRPPEMPYRRWRLPLASKIVSAVGRMDYVRVRIVNRKVEPVAVSGAALLSTTVSADGFVLVERDREGHAPGEEVDIWLYD